MVCCLSEAWNVFVQARGNRKSPPSRPRGFQAKPLSPRLQLYRGGLIYKFAATALNAAGESLQCHAQTFDALGDLRSL